MTYLKASMLLFSLCIFSIQANNKTDLLEPELVVFTPYLGTWQADFHIDKNPLPTQDVTKWERTLNGKAIRTTHSINEGEYGGESMIFYDRKKQSLVFYYFTTAGFYTKGVMKVLSPTQFVAYEDVTGSQEGITKVKSTSEFKDEQFVVSTSYLKKGEWTKPQIRTYHRSNKEVKFK
ncbi:hypothetical protein [Pseudoalteromonas sp. SiA1]|uniref:hypothetical protein n=1 Tax=Pseudoalteromonas sp. SiA1 TaxID=2839744 RepID=UPI001C0055F9|nr:hypothetical protein [Pseudoalteromonas sp. SiA1]QWF34334.1 hypothetical protein KK487_17570 [Pseudoalteromonas sp. SiA1]